VPPDALSHTENELPESAVLVAQTMLSSAPFRSMVTPRVGSALITAFGSNAVMSAAVWVYAPLSSQNAFSERRTLRTSLWAARS
jgi:hypothetical protein